MGRAGRYTLSVMAWVVAYAGWSAVLGLVIAAATGERPRTVSLGASVAFMIVGPLVPTLVALWFNDWARDGFPSRDERLAARERAAAPPAPVEPGPVERAAVEPGPVAATAGAGWGLDAAQAAAPAVPAMPPAPAAQPTAAPPRTVEAHPLGVPSAPEPAGAAPGAFPVAPLLRDRD